MSVVKRNTAPLAMKNFRPISLFLRPEIHPSEERPSGRVLAGRVPKAVSNVSALAFWLSNVGREATMAQANPGMKYTDKREPSLK
jgi:hypothetical protein